MSIEEALKTTLRGDLADVSLDLDVTAVEATASERSLPTSTATPRTTVLPRRREPGAEPAEGARPRFDVVRTLGEGGMGRVELARDNDIRRTVAVKRLRGDARSEEAYLRFADEVRIVGQLEHPAIVPVYDVGQDEAGHVYAVMKHLSGETMEEIIEKLRAGDPAYVAKYSIAYRVQLFLSILDAMRYAHSRGVLHRDLKPANIMIGHFGEVTVLDWGIAKPIKRGAAGSVPPQPLARTLADSHDRRLQETQLGALAGTPLYMSPEQAAGRNDELDERSDVYSLCVLLYEWLSLQHPLADKQTVTEVLAATINGLDISKVATNALFAGVPGEWVHVLRRGLQRDITKRFQSVDQLEDVMQRGLAGRMPVQCHVTFTKRVAGELFHWVDRHPTIFTALFFGSAFAIVGAVVYALIHALR